VELSAHGLSEFAAVVSLLCYSLCLITLLTAVAGAMIGLFISTSDRVGHTSHPRPAIERDDRELRLFMVAPKIKYGSPARNGEASSVAVPGKKTDTKKTSRTRPSRSLDNTTTTNDRAMGTRKTPKSGADRVVYFQPVTRIGDNSRAVLHPFDRGERRFGMSPLRGKGTERIKNST
jgi:DNA-directed RNA polymerase subunit M/transcription elongation factor TFIIS